MPNVPQAGSSHADGRYYTIGRREETLLKVEGSKFIAEAMPVFSRDEAEASLQAVRKAYFDATHHCYAYALGETRRTFQYSDDGEPSGTAGIKIFSAMQSEEMSDLLIVVTRYFGGVKLGVGGLGRAYHEAAVEVLKKSTRIVRLPVVTLTISVAYTFVTPLMNLCARQGAAIDHADYSEEVVFTVLVPVGKVEEIEHQIIQLTNGSAVLARGEYRVRSIA